jgi:hypothetical protein
MSCEVFDVLLIVREYIRIFPGVVVARSPVTRARHRTRLASFVRFDALESAKLLMIVAKDFQNQVLVYTPPNDIGMI